MPECPREDGKLRMEFPLLLLIFGFMVSGTLNSNLILFKTCFVTLKYNETECRVLITNVTDNSTKGLEEIVQTHATYIITASSIIENILPSIYCMFLGPWSDKHGRKPLIVMSLLAFVAADMIRIVITIIPTASPWLLLLSSLTAVSTGGFAIFYSAVLCYLTDTTTKKNRGIRMGVLEGFMAFGFLTGMLSASYIFNYIDFVGSFLVSTSCIILSLIYVILFVPESIQSSVTFKAKVCDLFRFEHVAVMMRTTFKQREYYTRAILLSVLTITWLNVLNINGDTNIIYLYIREKFHWDLQHYTFYSAGRAVCLVIGTIFGIYFLHKLFRVNEVPLIIMGFVSLIISLLIQGFANQDWHLYLGAAIRSMGGVLSPMMRSLVSKIVPTEELGKIFPFTVACESIVTLVAAPMYTILYDATIKTYPGAYNFFTAGVNVINVLFAVAVFILRRHQPEYQLVEDS